MRINRRDCWGHYEVNVYVIQDLDLIVGEDVIKI